MSLYVKPVPETEDLDADVLQHVAFTRDVLSHPSPATLWDRYQYISNALLRIHKRLIPYFETIVPTHFTIGGVAGAARSLALSKLSASVLAFAARLLHSTDSISRQDIRDELMTLAIRLKAIPPFSDRMLALMERAPGHPLLGRLGRHKQRDSFLARLSDDELLDSANAPWITTLLVRGDNTVAKDGPTFRLARTMLLTHPPEYIDVVVHHRSWPALLRAGSLPRATPEVLRLCQMLLDVVKEKSMALPLLMEMYRPPVAAVDRTRTISDVDDLVQATKRLHLERPQDTLAIERLLRTQRSSQLERYKRLTREVGTEEIEERERARVRREPLSLFQHVGSASSSSSYGPHDHEPPLDGFRGDP